MYDNGQRPGKRIWSGYIRPRNLVKKGTPLFEDTVAIGKEGNYFTSFRIRLYGATMQYPTPSLTLNMGNGAGSAFARISITEIDTLLAKLQEWKDKLLQLQPTLESQKRLVEEQLKTADMLSQITAPGTEPTDFHDEELQDIDPDTLKVLDSLLHRQNNVERR